MAGPRSHVLAEVKLAADRVAVERAGMVVALGTVAKLRGQARHRVEVWFKDDPPTTELLSPTGFVQPVVDDHRFTATLAGSIQTTP